jgi:very-short-patch-repair endonuclease
MPYIISFCRELRKNQTPAEILLWSHLRDRRFFGHKFLRQHPICGSYRNNDPLYYIADFYCDAAKLVIEADGPIHLLKKDYDQNRDEVMKAMNLKVLRFENDLILNETNAVLEEIRQHFCKT